ncbi:MAG: transporter substrate-binding domain-containing protein [Desulfobacterales bacterium]|nr:transporter substrate-binding domain-containing protein [Desulfobacterales bacterium]
MSKKFLLLIGIICLLPCISFAEPLKIFATDWPPYEMLENGKPAGLATELIDAVLKEMKIEYKVEFVPWKRAEAMAKGGEADVLYSVSKKAEREEFLYYPETPLHPSTYVFFIRKADKDKLKFNSFDDLKGHTIGITRGYTYSDDLMKFLKEQKNSDEASSDEENFKKLEKARFNYFPCELANGISLLKKLGFADAITYIEKPIVEKMYYVAFAKASKNPDIKKIVDEFNKNFKAFKEKEEYKKITDKYLK